MHMDGIGHLLERYLSTGMLPFEEFSDIYLFPGEAKSSHTMVPTIPGGE